MAKQKLKHPGKRDPAVVEAPPGPATKVPAAAPVEDRSAKNRSPKGRPPKSQATKGKSKVKVARKGSGQAAEAASPAGDTGGKSAPMKLVHKILRRPKSLGRLERLELAVDEVRRGSRTSPRTRKLQTAGVPKMAQKVIEEAGEVALEATLGNRTALINESVDLLYNLLVLLGACDVSLDALWTEMDRREVTLGMAEKLPKTFDPDA